MIQNKSRTKPPNDRHSRKVANYITANAASKGQGYLKGFCTSLGNARFIFYIYKKPLVFFKVVKFTISSQYLRQIQEEKKYKREKKKIHD